MTDYSIWLNAWAALLEKACWQGSAMVLAVWLICRTMPSMPSAVKCWLWRLAMLKFVAVLALPSVFNLPLLPAPSAVATEYEGPFIANSVAAPIASASVVQDEWMEHPSLQTVLLFLWLIGSGWCVVRLAAAWRAMVRLRKRCRGAEHALAVEQLQSLTRHFGLRAMPALLEVEGDGSPMLIGILRPVIVIPRETLYRLSGAELAMVLGHELAHIRRSDLVWNLMAGGVRAVFFFHPLVWLCQRRMSVAQEIAADELAILKQNHDPVGYGKLLVSVIGKMGPSRLLPTMSMGTAGSVQSLTRRLIAMSLIGRARRRMVVASGMIVATIFLLGIVPWQLVAAEPREGAEHHIAGSAECVVIPPATAAMASPTRPENQRLVRIKVWEAKKGQPKVILNRPMIVFDVGQKAHAEVCNKETKLVIAVRSLVEKKPIQHEIEVKWIRNPESKRAATLMAPMLTMTDDQTGIVSSKEGDGCEFGVEVTIPAFDAKSKQFHAPAATDGSKPVDFTMEIPALTKLLQSKDGLVRANVSDILGLLGAQANESVPALTELLEDKDEQVHKSAAEAIDKIKRKRELPERR